MLNKSAWFFKKILFYTLKKVEFKMYCWLTVLIQLKAHLKWSGCCVVIHLYFVNFDLTFNSCSYTQAMPLLLICREVKKNKETKKEFFFIAAALFAFSFKSMDPSLFKIPLHLVRFSFPIFLSLSEQKSKFEKVTVWRAFRSGGIATRKWGMNGFSYWIFLLVSRVSSLFFFWYMKTELFWHYRWLHSWKLRLFFSLSSIYF